MSMGVKKTTETGRKEEFLSSSPTNVSLFPPKVGELGFYTILADPLLLPDAALGVL